MRAINGDKLRGHLETMVLSVLAQSEAHGMQILRRLEEAGCGLLRLKEGSLYPALYRLESAGLVRIVRIEETDGKRGARRRIYGLTVKGKRELAKSREDWVSFVRIIGGIVGALA
jgi:PadR family transcriptional regulator PadR